VFRRDAVAAAAAAQRDSAIPNGEAGISFSLDSGRPRTRRAWRHAGDAAEVARHRRYRAYTIPSFEATPTDSNSKRTARRRLRRVLAIMPASKTSRENSLAVTPSTQRGEGIGDQYTAFATASTTGAERPGADGGEPEPDVAASRQHVDRTSSPTTGAKPELIKTR